MGCLTPFTQILVRGDGPSSHLKTLGAPNHFLDQFLRRVFILLDQIHLVDSSGRWALLKKDPTVGYASETLSVLSGDSSLHPGVQIDLDLQVGYRI